MESQEVKIEETLNTLLILNNDAFEGYSKAAQKVNNLELSLLFEDRSKERQQFCDQIKEEIKSAKLTIDDGGSVAGGLHRVWMELKAILLTDEDLMLIKEIEKGELEAVKLYENFLDTPINITMSTKILMREQLKQIKNDLLEIQSLRKERN